MSGSFETTLELIEQARREEGCGKVLVYAPSRALCTRLRQAFKNRWPNVAAAIYPDVDAAYLYDVIFARSQLFEGLARGIGCVIFATTPSWEELVQHAPLAMLPDTERHVVLFSTAPTAEDFPRVLGHLEGIMRELQMWPGQ